MSNPAIPRNYLVMVCRHSALLGLLSALGALGRRFESCRPDSHSSGSEIPVSSLTLEKVARRVAKKYVLVLKGALLMIHFYKCAKD